jgi:hypothetical protein
LIRDRGTRPAWCHARIKPRRGPEVPFIAGQIASRTAFKSLRSPRSSQPNRLNKTNPFWPLALATKRSHFGRKDNINKELYRFLRRRSGSHRTCDLVKSLGMGADSPGSGLLDCDNPPIVNGKWSLTNSSLISNPGNIRNRERHKGSCQPDTNLLDDWSDTESLGKLAFGCHGFGFEPVP